MPGSAVQAVRGQTAVEETAVRFAECTEAEIDDTFGHGTPNPETAAPLKAFDETIERVDGSEEEVHRERWLYCFRLEETSNGEGEVDRAAYVSEYKVDENGKYQRVPGTGPDREPNEKKKDAVHLQTKSPYDPNPTHFFWLSRHKLPAGRKEAIRRQIQKAGTISFMKGVSVRGASDDTVEKTGDGTAMREIYVAEYGRIAEKRHRRFAEKVDAFSRWHHAIAPAKMLNDIVDSFVEADQDVFRDSLEEVATETETRMKRGHTYEAPTNYRPTYKLWREAYQRIKREMQSAIEERAKALIACLSSTAFSATLHHFALGDEELWAEGEALYARVIEDLTFAEAGQEYLQDQYAASDLGVNGMHALKREQSEVEVPEQVKKFNPLNLTFRSGRSITKGAFGMLEAYSAVVPRVHTQRETKKVVTGMLAVCRGYEPNIVLKNGQPVDKGGHLVFEQRPIIKEKEVWTSYTTYEPESQHAARLRKAVGGKIGELKVLGAIEGVNVVLSSIALAEEQNWKNSMSAVAATSNVVQWMAEEGLLARENTLTTLVGRQVTQRLLSKVLLKWCIALDVLLGGWDIVSDLRTDDYTGAFGNLLLTIGGVSITAGLGGVGLSIGAATLGGLSVSGGPVTLIILGAILATAGVWILILSKERALPSWLESVCLWGSGGPDMHDTLIDLVQSKGKAADHSQLEELTEEINEQMNRFVQTAFSFSVSAYRGYRDHPYTIGDTVTVELNLRLLTENSELEVDLSGVQDTIEPSGRRRGRDESGSNNLEREWTYRWSVESSIQGGQLVLSFFDASRNGIEEKLQFLEGVKGVGVEGLDEVLDRIEGDKVSVSVYPYGDGKSITEENKISK